MSSPEGSVQDWMHFFLAAGIPKAVSAKYAKTFSEQRITQSMCDDLDKGVLRELGITTIGDQIAVLRHFRNLKERGSNSLTSISSTSPTLGTPKTIYSRSEVSSTTSDIYSRLGVHGLVSDRLPGSTTVVETIKSSALRPECRKREAVATNMRTGLKSVRSLDDGRHSNLGGPTFRVRLSQNTSAGRTVLRKRTSPRTIPVRARLKMVGQSMNATSRTYGKRPYPTSRFRRASIFDRLG